jgi:hypothetical protein
MSEYKIEPTTGICVRVVNPDAKTFKGWKDCTADQLSKKVSEPYSVDQTDDKKDEPETAPTGAKELEDAKKERNKKIWKNVAIVSGVLIGVGLIVFVVRKGIKNS